MQDFPYILSECEDINSLLYKPINSAQRIKYTCFNVSPNYIVLGSSSGSIYLFSREPCSFLHLIPLSKGAVIHVLISPDEKAVALATARGLVCLITLKPTAKLVAISKEHLLLQINCLCWNDNSSEVYIGDATGKVSVMVLSIFTVNSMFQVPTCTLMYLQSNIVQLNFCSSLLLVSTLTRCYICNTVQEQYKRIGNKPRNGEFGACFYKLYTEECKNTSVVQKEEKVVNSKKGLFNFIPESDNNMIEEDSIRIFCARPGSRLWEVSTNGIVMKTHQFKEALSIPPLKIYKQNPQKSVFRNQAEQTQQTEQMPQYINFSHLFVIAQRYLFSYTSNSLCIIDPISATIILWNNEFTNITMANVIDNKIYLMTCDNEFHCLTFCSIDSVILLLYSNKQYYECANVCITYKSQLLKSTSSKDIDKIYDLENKPRLEDSELSRLLLPLLSVIQSNINMQPIKLDSGIVVVNTRNANLKTEDNCSYKHMFKTSTAVNDNEESCVAEETNQTEEALGATGNSAQRIDLEIDNLLLSKISETEHDIDTTLETDIEKGSEFNLENDLDHSKPNTNIDIIYKVQSDLEPAYTLANSIKFSMTKEDIENIIIHINKIINTTKDTYESLTELKTFMYEIIRTTELYYFNTFLENVSIQLLSSINNDFIIKEFMKAFIDINSQNYPKCLCNYPYPMEQLKEPKFLAVGRVLLKKFSKENRKECLYICNKVPYMWREYLPFHIEQQQPLNDILYECLQMRDNIILSILLPVLDIEQWSCVSKCLKNLKEGRCLFCLKPIKEIAQNDSPIDWIGVIEEFMKREGPDKAMEFLMKLETFVPDVSFDTSIFQSLIFTKILYHHGLKRIVNFNKNNPETSEYNTMCSVKIRDQLMKTLEKDLGRSVNKSIFGSGAHHWGMQYQSKSSICSCCTLSLQTPILLGNNGVALFSCGHAYHVNCMIERKLTKCNLHS